MLAVISRSQFLRTGEIRAMGEIIAILVLICFLRELERITKMGEGSSAAIAILRLVKATRILWGSLLVNVTLFHVRMPYLLWNYESC